MGKSFVLQGLRYLARPDDGIRRTPLLGLMAWRGADLSTSQWSSRLTPDDIEEIDAAINHRRDVVTQALTRADFPLPQLSQRLSQWLSAHSRAAGSAVESRRSTPTATSPTSPVCCAFRGPTGRHQSAQ